MTLRNGKALLIALMATSAALAFLGVLILTDVGQVLGIGKAAVVTYFQNHVLVMALSAALFVVAAILNRKLGLLKTWMMAVFGVFVVGCFLATKFVTPYILFPAQQRNAEYRTAADVDGYLEPEDTLYVVEHNGVSRAYPQKYLWQSHIFGADFGGEEVTMTYCVLTNLPIPYVNDLNGKPMDLKVLAQTNNNLLLWDTNSGEIIQQITNTCELSKRKLEPLPVLEMTWKSFQELYPESEVLYNPFTSPIERVLEVLMPLEAAHGGDEWMFNTVDVSDDRLPSKEKVIGVEDGGAAVAFTKEYLRNAGILNTRVGEKSIAIAHIAEHDIFVAFDRMKDGQEIEVTSVDAFGNTPDHGELERAFIYNGPMWAVWLHYRPETKLFQ